MRERLHESRYCVRCGGASQRVMAKNSQPAESSAAPQNRMPHLIIRSLCTATCRSCSCVGNVWGTRYSEMRAAPIATTHHAPKPTSTSAMRLAQMGAAVRRHSQRIQARNPPSAAAKTMIIMDDDSTRHRRDGTVAAQWTTRAIRPSANPGKTGW
jgi:hypothetical protein